MEEPLDKLLRETNENVKNDPSGKNPGLLIMLRNLSHILVELDRQTTELTNKGIQLNESINRLTVAMAIVAVITLFVGIPSCIVSCQVIEQTRKQPTSQNEQSRVSDKIINTNKKSESSTFNSVSERGKPTPTSKSNQ